MIQIKKLLRIAAALLIAGGASAAASDQKPAETSTKAHEGCAGEKMADKGDGSCCQKGAAAAKTAACKPAHDKEVTLTGKVLCEHCDLHTSKSCSPALVSEGRKEPLHICSTSKDLPGMRSAGEVEVKGYVHAGPDGHEEIEVVSFFRKPSKVS